MKITIRIDKTKKNISVDWFHENLEELICRNCKNWKKKKELGKERILECKMCYKVNPWCG